MAVKASASITLSAVVDVDSTTRYYLLQSSTSAFPSKPTSRPPGGFWDDSEPAYVEGSTNSLYFVDLTVFSDGTWVYSNVSLSSSYEAAKLAYNKAQSAVDKTEDLDKRLHEAELKVEKDAIVATVTESVKFQSKVQNEIDKLEIGGRNLILNSASEISNNYYTIGSYTPSTFLIEGEKYTISLCVTPAKDVTEILAALSNGYVGGTLLVPVGTDKQIIQKTFSAHYGEGHTPEDDPANGNITLYRRPKDESSTEITTVHWIKVEKGDKATDWTPAPEDVDGALRDASDEIGLVANEVNEVGGAVQSASEAAKAAHEAAKAAQTSADANAETMEVLQTRLTQTANGLSIVRTQTLPDLEGRMKTLESGVHIEGSRIGIYTSDSPFKNTITHSGWEITENDTPVVVCAETKLIAPRVQTTDAFMIGGLAWKVGRDGHTRMLKYGRASSANTRMR